MLYEVITIGAVPSLWDVYLGNLIITLRENHPELAIVAEASSTDSLIRALLGQSIDIAFTYDYPQIPDLAIREAMTFRITSYNVCYTKLLRIFSSRELFCSFPI